MFISSPPSSNFDSTVHLPGDNLATDSLDNPILRRVTVRVEVDLLSAVLAFLEREQLDFCPVR